MRRMPTDVRRVEAIWRSLYQKLGGGGYCEDAELDARWPRGLQPAVRVKPHGFRVALDLHDWSDRRSYFHGRFYQEDVDRLIWALAAPGDHYWDIGANIGMILLTAARRIGPAGRALAFEPNPLVLERLNRTIADNRLRRVRVVPAALGAAAGSATLALPGEHSGIGTLTQTESAPARTIPVRVETGDGFASELDASRPLVVKIDVEGFETLALRGMPRVLERPEIALVIEVTDRFLRRTGSSAADLHGLLAGFGFSAWQVSAARSRWRVVPLLRPLSGPLERGQYNALFARPASHLFSRVSKFASPAGAPR